MRTHPCGAVTTAELGDEVTFCGWAHRRRDHGGVIFIDLRDHTGLVQVVFDPDRAETFARAEDVRNEFVLRITGRVRARPAGTVNPDMRTGEIEVLGHELEILNRAATPPFQLDDANVSEENRLRFRYIDLRRPEMQERLRLRARVVGALRRRLDADGFIEVDTPMLTRATPEGARDYLVPSRTHPGEFFALPQSPQLFKQLLMMGGIDRYYQVARCFRDEDLRADRQPEFTQLDIEMSFVDEDTITTTMEAMMRDLFKEVLDVSLTDTFPRMSYADAMQRYGSDKPDLRIPLELVELSDVVAGVDFKVFAEPARSAKGRVAALRVPGGNALSRKEIDVYTEFVGRYGAKGLAYIKCNDVAAGPEGLQSPIVKFFPAEVLATIIERTGAVDGDLIFFGADRASVVEAALGALRVQIGQDRGMVEDGWRPLWVVDFPMETARPGGATSRRLPRLPPVPGPCPVQRGHCSFCSLASDRAALHGTRGYTNDKGPLSHASSCDNGAESRHRARDEIECFARILAARQRGLDRRHVIAGSARHAETTLARLRPRAEHRGKETLMRGYRRLQMAAREPLVAHARHVVDGHA